MDINPDQIEAARARDCVFTPATEEQVRRLAMQRRVFRVGGAPYLAVRNGFFETHGTLAALIEGHRPAAPPSNHAPGGVPTPVHAEPMQADPLTTSGRPDAAVAQRDDTVASPVKPRKARTARSKPPSSVEVATIAAVNVEAPMAESAATKLGTPTRTTRVRVAGRRAGEPPMPRWMTAGKERRGRLK